MKSLMNFDIKWLIGLLTIVCLLSIGCEPQEELNQDKLLSGTVDPSFTEGAPYPAEEPIDKDPINDMPAVPVPDGPLVGELAPLNEPMNIRPVDVREGDSPDRDARAPLFYKQYTELDNLISVTSGCCPEISVAENGQTVIMTGNTWMALSEDGGSTFTYINPTTIFPNNDGALCCDQVVEYVPQIDMFVWILQYWNNSSGDNKIRFAAQKTQEVRNSNGTSWTYWDFSSNIFDANSTLDYNDLSFGNSSIWWTTQNGKGRVVVRIPQSQVAAKGTINFGYTAGTSNALWSHLTHNATNTVYWAGHLNNSQMRVYSMKDGDGFYAWRTVNINSWPNGTNSSTTPSQDWLLPFESWKHYVFGNALQGGSVWFSWLASSNENFPQPHVQMVKVNTSSYTLVQQVQIWNPDFAFMDAFLSTNTEGELGMDIAFGGGTFHPSNAVGVWGDYVVYYPRLSTRTTNRWGNYNTSRRSASKGLEWVAGGYTMETDAGGSNIMRPHYIRFGR